MADSARLRGWKWDGPNDYLEVGVNGNMVARFNCACNDLRLLTNGLLVDAGGLTITAGGQTITAGGLTVTAGGATITACGLCVTAGNANLGAAGSFACTQPDMALKLNSGVAPVGAITTAGGIFATDTGINKIIAAGTANAIQT